MLLLCSQVANCSVCSASRLLKSATSHQSRNVIGSAPACATAGFPKGTQAAWWHRSHWARFITWAREATIATTSIGSLWTPWWVRTPAAEWRESHHSQVISCARTEVQKRLSHSRRPHIKSSRQFVYPQGDVHSCRSKHMAGEVRDSDSDSLLANLLSLLSCNACWRSHYEAPPEQSTEPPVQSLAQSLIPSSFGPVSAQPSVEEEGYASLLPAGKPGSGTSLLCHAAVCLAMGNVRCAWQCRLPQSWGVCLRIWLSSFMFWLSRHVLITSCADP